MSRRTPTSPRRAPRRSSDARAGFTLVELLVVALIISILGALVQPNLRRALVKARAAEAVGTLDAIRVAVLNYQADSHTWPRDVNRGRIPPGLGAYLPDGFTFRPEHFTIDYDNWSGRGRRSFVGLSVITEDEEVGREMVSLLGANAWTNGRDRFTWVIQWTD